MKIGVFGGTFDPPHVGHLIVAQHVRDQAVIDRVLFVPASIPPHKQRSKLSTPSQRLKMVELSLQGNPGFELCDIELKRGGVSYSVDTLKELKDRYPDDAIALLVGMDMMADFPTWRATEEILEIAEVIVMSRSDVPIPALDPALKRQLTFCRVPSIGISSREIRRRVGEGKSVRYLVPSAVRMYIEESKLYLGGSAAE